MDPTKKELYGAKRSSGVSMNEEEIRDAWKDVKDDGSDTNWLLISYVAGSNSAVHVVATGNGGVSEMLAHLNDDSSFFCVVRCKIGSNIKFYSLFYVGNNVGGMARGKASMHKSAILNLFEVHGELSCVGLENATTEDLASQIARLSGIATTTIEF